jgi:predicted regulator of Ras-like GTPase activity (Roadblock/LC7/MglB family)
MVSRVDAATALADLTEISSEIEAAVILDANGAVLAATEDDGGAERLARAGVELLRVARERLSGERRAPTQIEAALREGSVFVVHANDRSIVARTSARPATALVFHDLAACLESLPRKRSRNKPKATAGA